MGIALTRELDYARSLRERQERNADTSRHREQQHSLDIKRERIATENFKNLLKSQELQPLVNVFMHYLKEHAEHVKASRKRRETRFKEERGNMKPPRTGGRSGPRIPPHPGNSPGPRNGGIFPNVPPPHGARGRYSPDGRPPEDLGYGEDDDNDDDGNAGGVRLPPHHPPRGSHRYPPRPDNDDHVYEGPHRPSGRRRPRDPHSDGRYMMHGGRGPPSVDDAFPAPEGRQRGPRRSRGGYGAGFAPGQNYRRGGRRGGGGRRPGPGSAVSDEENLGSATGQGGNAGSADSNPYGSPPGGRRGMPPRRGMRRGGSE
ncbi:hypothetical protein MMC08_005326 [Hypocenomyce scalaris]|nr:hypothetical protein [Hypocenomyce scalaris]